jgi:hypothetical protein
MPIEILLYSTNEKSLNRMVKRDSQPFAIPGRRSRFTEQERAKGEQREWQIDRCDGVFGLAVFGLALGGNEGGREGGGGGWGV